MNWFNLNFKFPTGHYLANGNNTPQRPVKEWPPKPSRVFQALVSAWGLNGACPNQKSVVDWFAGLNPPSITCTPVLNLESNDNLVSTYLPINEENTSQKKKTRFVNGEMLIVNKQARPVPGVFGENLQVSYTYQYNTHDQPIVDQLVEMVKYIPRLGKSLVNGWVDTTCLTPTMIPAPRGIKITGHNKLYFQELCHSFNNAPDYRPNPPQWNYIYASDLKAQTPESNWNMLIYRLDGSPVHLDGFWGLVRGLRASVSRILGDMTPESISGHTSDGKPTRHNHVAYVPLAHTTGLWADSMIKGIAVCIPRDIPYEDRCTLVSVLSTFQSENKVELGNFGTWNLIRDEIPQSWSLNYNRWCNESTVWTSVTPVVLDAHIHPSDPKFNQLVVNMAIRAGIPIPQRIEASMYSYTPGVPNVWQFPAYVKPNPEGIPIKRFTYHMKLVFDKSVTGPMMFGYGRHQGFGFFQPE